MSNQVLFTEDQWRKALAFTLVLAIEGRTDTYGNLARRLGLPTRGSYMANVLAAILDSIDGFCRERGMEPTNTLVVNQQGLPGNGYFRLHDRLGKYKLSEESGAASQIRESRRKYWALERDEVFNYWTK